MNTLVRYVPGAGLLAMAVGYVAWVAAVRVRWWWHLRRLRRGERW